MNIFWVDSLIQGSGFMAEFALILVILWKARWRSLPVFTALAVYVPLEDVVLIAASHVAPKHIYFWAFWSFATGDYCIQLALVAEIARNVLRPTRTWIPGARTQFAIATLTGTAGVLSLVRFVVKPPMEAHELLYRRASLFTSLLTCVCFFALTVIANSFQLPRKDHTRAIGQGLAVWNVACVIGDASLSTGMSIHTVYILDHIRMMLWVVVLVYWTRALWMKEKIHMQAGCETNVFYDIDRQDVA